MAVNGKDITKVSKNMIAQVKQTTEEYAEKTEERFNTVLKLVTTKHGVERISGQIAQHLNACGDITRNKDNNNDNTDNNTVEIKQGRDINPASLISGSDSQKPNN